MGCAPRLAVARPETVSCGRSGRFEIEIVGTRRPATLLPGCLWDPSGHRLRS